MPPSPECACPCTAADAVDTTGGCCSSEEVPAAPTCADCALCSAEEAPDLIGLEFPAPTRPELAGPIATTDTPAWLVTDWIRPQAASPPRALDHLKLEWPEGRAIQLRC